MFDDNHLKETAKDSRELLRAEELVRRNKVREFRTGDASATASIAGSGKNPYLVELRYDLTGTCTCPAYLRSKRRWCKHLIAVGMVVLEHKDGLLFDAGNLDPELADAVAALSEEEVRNLLLDAGARFEAVRRRLLEGEWPSL